MTGEALAAGFLMPFEQTRRNHVCLEYHLRDDIDGDILQTAVLKTLEIYPYMRYGLILKNGKWFFTDDKMPIRVKRGYSISLPHGSESCARLVSVNYVENRMYITISHTLCAAKGAEMFAESLIYQYYLLNGGDKTGVDGIRAVPEKDPEILFKDVDYSADSCPGSLDIESLYELNYELPFAGAEPEDTGIVAQLKLRNDDFFRFAKTSGSGITVALFLLMAETVDRLYPETGEEAVISSDVMADIGHIMGAPDTIKNALTITRVYIPRCDLKNNAFDINSAGIRDMLSRQLTAEYVNYKHFHPVRRIPATFMLSYAYNRSPLSALDGYVTDFDVWESGTRKIDYYEMNGVFTINLLFDGKSNLMMEGLQETFERHDIPVGHTKLITLNAEDTDSLYT